MDLTFLGTGNAFAPTRYWSSFLVNDRYLFDAPPTLMPHLKKLGKNPGDIEVIFISHFHGDHYFGLPFLLLEYAELAPRTKPLTIIGPPGIKKRVESSTNLAFANVYRKQSRGYDLEFVEVKDGRSGSCAGCDYTAFGVQHVPDLDSFAFRVVIDGQIIAYTGDSSLCDALYPLADGADVFVAECSCWTETCGPIHLTPSNILELRRKITPSTKFILTHIGAGEAPASIAAAGILIADDLKTITV
jgi:ribonuclease BN (tRNA processing enzyme)